MLAVNDHYLFFFSVCFSLVGTLNFFHSDQEEGFGGTSLDINDCYLCLPQIIIIVAFWGVSVNTL